MRVCGRCGKKRDLSRFYGHRTTCRDCKTEQHQAWARKNRDKYAKYMRQYRLSRLPELKAYGEAYRRAAKLDAIRHYSKGAMRCACCGESEIGFLNIDHMNGGGTKERKTTGRGGSSFAIYLRKRGFPPGYRILCYNCNCALAHFKVCPHERTRNVAVV